jgi:hypothetical protein
MSSQPDKPVLRLDWCSHAAAKYAVEHWHYSKCLPMGKTVKVGAWESGKFIGSVVFGMGTNRDFGKPFGLAPRQVCELNRVALSAHTTPTSRIVSIAVRILVAQSTGLRLIVSFADPFVGHHGGIYQAMGWICVEPPRDARAEVAYTKGGKRYSWRTVAGLLNKRGMASTTESAKRLGFVTAQTPPKHKYLMPLDAEMRARILPLAKPYPKRAGSDTKDTPAHRAGEGGSTPTPALPPPETK